MQDARKQCVKWQNEGEKFEKEREKERGQERDRKERGRGKASMLNYKVTSGRRI
jgi:hypothetical protein